LHHGWQWPADAIAAQQDCFIGFPQMGLSASDENMKCTAHVVDLPVVETRLQ
jgi:hypothetical protein